MVEITSDRGGRRRRNLVRVHESLDLAGTDRTLHNGICVTTVERTLVGATMQVAVNLHNLSNLAFRVKNLQVTALSIDPLDHSRLTPVATLTPDSEPEDGFTLGPLVSDRGPIIFSNSTIIPSLVESLMANSTGLIFRISNYDIVNEDGRNFAFTSQDVVERTGAVLIDFGGANDLLAVQQFTVHGQKIRRPDVVLFVNGLPLVVIELKNPGAEQATVKGAWNQVQTYRNDIPAIFAPNAVCVVSDGLGALMGSMFDRAFRMFTDAFEKRAGQIYGGDSSVA